jgi:hypothetical protein
MSAESVWIASTDAPEEPAMILGVFATQQAASAFIDSVLGDFPENSLVYGEYQIGWHVGQDAEGYRSE